MNSGREVLADIDRSLQQLREELHKKNDRASLASNQLVEARQHESGIYRKLAKLRADDIQSGSFTQALDQAEQQAVSLLEKRNQALENLNGRMQASLDEQKSLELKRQRQAANASEASKALQAQIDITHAALEKTQQYQTQLSVAQKAVDTLGAAKEKSEKTEKEHASKGEPYRTDKLFSYLWERNYGTSNYQAGLISRFFDDLLAKHIRYEAARRNYFMLEEIPRRLREHCKQLEKRAGEEMDVLSALEHKAEQADGVPGLEKVVSAEKDVLAALDVSIQQKVSRYGELLEEREKYVTGKDEYFSQAIAVLISNFKSEPIPQLRREAELTYGYDDDSLVSQLGDLRRRKDTLDQSLDDNRQVHQQYTLRLHDLEDIRERYKQFDFDAANSRFSDDASLSMLFSEFVRGAVDGDRLWHAVQLNQKFVRYRNYPSNIGVGIPGGFGFPGGIRIPRGIRIPGGLGGILGSGMGGRRSGFPGGGLSRRGGSRSSGGFHTGGGF